MIIIEEKMEKSDLMENYLNYNLCGKFISSGNWAHMKRNFIPFQVAFMLEGEMYITEEDREYIIRPGDILFFRSGLTHYGHKKSTSPVSFYWVMYETNIESYRGFPSFAHIEDTLLINQLFKQLLHFSSYSIVETNAALVLLLNELKRTLGRKYSQHRSVVDNICRWVDINLQKDINVSKVAEKFNFNKDYISKIVKREKGMGIKEYILSQRINRAKQLLLNTHLSVKQITKECGFFDYTQFLKMFKRYEGVTPKEYRNILYSTPMNTDLEDDNSQLHFTRC